MSWKEEAERTLEKRRAAERKREERTREERERRAAAEKEAEEERLLERHKRTFRCCVCGEPSQEPRWKSIAVGTVVDQYQRTLFEEVRDWSTPADLFKCEGCGQWACPDCYLSSEGLCRDCVQRRIRK
jgi:hypothetical protein